VEEKHRGFVAAKKKLKNTPFREEQNIIHMLLGQIGQKLLWIRHPGFCLW
jgi:hypothetical protein